MTAAAKTFRPESAAGPGLLLAPSFSRLWGVWGLPLAMSCTSSADANRDVVPISRDVVASAPASGTNGYDYVARRPLGVVALAEGRGLDPKVARAAVDRLADRLDSCLTEQGRSGLAAEGAARVVAQIGASGVVSATQVRIDPSRSGASTAIVCLVAPLKLLAFPPADHDGRGIAIEALWGQVQSSGRP